MFPAWPGLLGVLFLLRLVRILGLGTTRPLLARHRGNLHQPCTQPGVIQYVVHRLRGEKKLSNVTKWTELLQNILKVAVCILWPRNCSDRMALKFSLKVAEKGLKNTYFLRTFLFFRGHFRHHI